MSGSRQVKRLLFVVNTSWFFISHRLALAVAAREAGYDVHLATQVYSPAERQKILDAGITLHELEIPRSSTSVIANVRLLYRFARLYRRIRPEIVHHVTMKPNVLGGWAARLTRVHASVFAVSGLGFVFTGTGFRANLRRRVLKSVMRSSLGHRNSRVIFQNPDDERTLTEAGVVGRGRAVLIRGAGVDLADYPPTPESPGRVRVLLATRLLREKGVAEFVAAAKALRAAGVRADFLLAGEVDDQNPGSFTRDEVQAWHDAGHVEWLGHVPAMAPILAGVHVVTLPSYYGEGVPKVLIEAAAAARAIVTTDMPGCREIVQNEVNGLLVPPRDVEALSAALERLINTPAERMRMGTAGRAQVASEFTLAQVVGQTLQVYKTLTD